ncbi:hypothetical protein RUM44_007345 [Polyplax serrata]|uniref:Uncharacterized protein n=1 Tax=Polyplax serrata TaxID=468196 RepID=A0ABR1B0F3_POLSC
MTARKIFPGGHKPTNTGLKDFRKLCEAATKIQASFRGHLVRKSAPRKDEEEELSRELKKLDAKVGPISE